ncbi:MAG TPA: sigma-70 family RNA polymerase sigma factor [Actinomycetota bacterium]
MELEAMTVLGTRLSNGDSRAVEDVYQALGPRVLSYLRRRVPYDEAEDVMQRVFFEVWRSRGRYDPDRSLEAWVFAIARKRAIDHLRRPHHVTVPIDLVRRTTTFPACCSGSSTAPRSQRSATTWPPATTAAASWPSSPPPQPPSAPPPATPRPSRRRFRGWRPPRMPRPCNPTRWAGGRPGRAGGVGP